VRSGKDYERRAKSLRPEYSICDHATRPNSCQRQNGQMRRDVVKHIGGGDLCPMIPGRPGRKPRKKRIEKRPIGATA